MRPAPEFQSRRLEAAVHILLLEDDASFAELVREQLDHVPWARLQLEWVDTLAAARARLADGGFDLVITDLNMPDSRGLETVEALARASDRLVIVLTGDPEAGLREAAIARGAYDLVSKDRLDRIELERLVRLASMQAKTFRSLRESEERFRSLTQMSSDWYWEQDEELRYVPRAGGKGGFGGRCLPGDIGKRRWELDGVCAVPEARWREHQEVLAARKPFRDFEYERAYGDAPRWLSISGEPIFDEAGCFKGYRGTGRDVTERKRLDQMYVALNAANEAILRARSRDALLEKVCQIAVETGQFLLAVVYLLEPGELELRRVAASGAAARLNEDRRPSMDPSDPRGQGLIGLACRTGQPVISNDYDADPRKQGRPEWRTYPVGSVAVFPLRIEGEVAGAFGLQHANRHAFSAELMQLLQRLADNISFALENFRRDERRKGEERMVALEHAVTRVLSETDEPRDAVRNVIRAICEAVNCQGGRYFSLDEAAGLMRLRASWTNREGAMERFIAHSGKLGYARGEGLVGKAWESGDIEWTLDPASDPRVKHPELARQAGLKSSFSFPVHFEGRVCGVLSISSTAEHLADGRFLKALGVIGSQMGQYLQRKQAEQALTEGEARFRQTFELAATGIAHVALDRTCLRVNRRLCEVLGYAEHELVGRSVKDLSHPEDRDVMDPGIARLRSGEVASVRGEKRYLRKDGAVVWVELTVAVARDAAGEPQYEISLYEDITERKAAEDALRRFRAALDGSADMVLLVELCELRLIDFNDTACTYLGYQREELLGAPPQLVLEAAKHELLRKSFEALLAHPGRADSVVRTFRRKDGRTFEAEVLRRVIESPSGPILVLNARDLTERNLAQQRQAQHVRYQEKIARFGESALNKRQGADLVDDAVQTVHEALRADAVVYLEPGQAVREVVVRGLAGAALASSGTAAYAATHPIALALEHGELAVIGEDVAPLPFEWATPFRSAALVPVHGDDRVQGALCALSSKEGAFGPQESKFLVTAASVLSAGLRRIDSEGRLAFLAQFDALTGLPNRALLSDRFSQRIVQARRHAMPLGVLFIDLDDFKLVNDTLGHAGGDELLKESARRLQSAVRPGDTVARISGDEFAVILGDLAKADDAALVAQKVIDRLSAPMHIRDQEVFVTASIGIAAFPADGDDAEALLGAADAAMYRAKQSGRNTYEFFTADINQRTRARAQLGVELRRALERDEFVVAYQPKFDLRTGQPCAAEALLRWRHPERGLVAPGEFIPVLEETGLIVPVGEWILRRACDDLVAWKAAGIRQIPVAVNLSARQFRLQDLDARIGAIVAQAGVDPHLVELEITESQLMLDPEHAKRMMKSLSETGIRLAIDDFGTGYSSLSYLTRFPVSALKIDRSFVADVLKDHADAAIVRTIIDMAHTLGFIVIAEGVETDAQAALLRSLGCEQAQGYFFARPMPEADLRALISSSIEARPGNSRFASRYQ